MSRIRPDWSDLAIWALLDVACSICASMGATELMDASDNLVGQRLTMRPGEYLLVCNLGLVPR